METSGQFQFLGLLARPTALQRTASPPGSRTLRENLNAPLQPERVPGGRWSLGGIDVSSKSRFISCKPTNTKITNNPLHPPASFRHRTVKSFELLVTRLPFTSVLRKPAANIPCLPLSLRRAEARRRIIT